MSFVFGCLLLFDPAGDAYQVSLPVALAVGGTLAVLTAFAVTKVVRVSRTRARTGQEELVGEVGVVRDSLVPNGLVFVHGELWRAVTAGPPLRTGTPVVVDRIGDDLVLDVSRSSDPVSADEDTAPNT